MKSEIQNSKLETNPNIQMTQIQNGFGLLGILDFESVSDFGFRASNFSSWKPSYESSYLLYFAKN